MDLTRGGEKMEYPSTLMMVVIDGKWLTEVEYVRYIRKKKLKMINEKSI
jgi:hypothetical protein